jgi:hypothetical protein
MPKYGILIDYEFCVGCPVNRSTTGPMGSGVSS